MSDTNSQPEELKYFDKLNISVLSIEKIKGLIKRSIQNTINLQGSGKDETILEKQCFHIIGPAGVGKTQICYQIRKELSELLGVDFGISVIKAPVLSRDDFIIPFPVIEVVEGNGKNQLTKTVDFKMLYSDFVPKGEGTYGLFIIDEFSRGDHQLQQLLWQAQNESCIHNHKFPKNWFVISIDNPDDSEYSMNTFEDAAGLRRQLHLYSEVNTVDFLKYAEDYGIHSMVKQFIIHHPEHLYDFDSQKKGAVFSNPASWERVSNILWGYEFSSGEENLYKELDDIEFLCSGLLNTNMSAIFIDFCKDGIKKLIKPEDIIYNFKAIEERLNNLLEANNYTALGALVQSFFTYLTDVMPKMKKVHEENVVLFLTAIPVDIASVFVSNINNLGRRTEPFVYMNKLHGSLVKNKKYEKEFYDVLISCAKESK